MIVLGALKTVAYVVGLFGLTVFVHELGHFLVARWCGMVVETFSIGFGPALFQWKRGGVVYKIGVFPLGGYVALPQMDPGGDMEKPASANPGGPAAGPRPPPAAPLKRIAVSLAGATMNVLLALAIAAGFYVFSDRRGSHVPATTVGYVAPDSRAAAAGLSVGDRILSINQNTVRSWDDVVVNAALTERARVQVEAPDGARRELTIETEPMPRSNGSRYLRGVGKASACLVIGVEKGSPAEAAGVRRRDLIVTFGGRPVYGTADLIARITANRDALVPMDIERDGKRTRIEVKPRFNKQFNRIMIGIHFNEFDYTQKPLAQLWSWASPVFRVFQALATPSERAHVVGALSGPVGILRMYWMAASTSFLLALWLTGLLNVNLAIMNLLPIPVLDGGHIMFAAYEGVARRPPGPLFLLWAHRLFATLLIALILMLTFRDVRDLFRRPETPAAHSAPAAAPTPAP
jgi:regulator of sigma E protease